MKLFVGHHETTLISDKIVLVFFSLPVTIINTDTSSVNSIQEMR